MRATHSAPPTHPPATGPDRLADPALQADTLALHRILTELKRIYQFRDRDRICCYDISVTQCWALGALTRAGPLTLKQLAAQLFLDKSTASRVVDALERKGYVRRARHPDDARAVVLRATPAGARLYGRIDKDMLDQERRVLSAFEPEVRRSMIGLIGRLAEAAAAHLGARAGSCCAPD